MADETNGVQKRGEITVGPASPKDCRIVKVSKGPFNVWGLPILVSLSERAN